MLQPPGHPTVPEGHYRFPRTLRLRRRREFLVLQHAGRRFTSRHFVLQFERQPGSSDLPRLGITVSRKVGNAVVRNRLKRLIREFFRTHRALLPDGSRVVVIARRGSALPSAPPLRRELEELFQRASRSHHRPVHAQAPDLSD